MTQRDIDHLIELASQNICDGVIEEPRVYFDEIPIRADGVVSKGDPNVFINGEQFPVRITRVSFALRGEDIEGTFTLPDERLLARVGVRFVFHDAYYQSAVFQPVPLWSNVICAGARGLTPGYSSYVFDRPLVLSARDTLRVVAALEAAEETARTATVGFHGVGLQSKRPYLLGASRDLTAITPVTFQGADYRNDGTEPIALTEMVVRLSATTDDPTGAGDVRLGRFNVRTVGNGTGSDWFIGPSTPAPISQCFGANLGFTLGRAVVHQIPNEGWLWEPGEGITVDANALADEAEGLVLTVAMSGYISLV